MAYCVPLGIPHSVFLEWDPVDQDKALGYQRQQRSLCPGCRTREEEWAQDRFAYVGQMRECPGCEVLEQEQQNVREDAKGHTHVYLVPRELAKTPDEEGIEG